MQEHDSYMSHGTDWLIDKREQARDKARIYHAQMLARKGDYSAEFARIVRLEGSRRAYQGGVV
jgi:hypothetical protein